MNTESPPASDIPDSTAFPLLALEAREAHFRYWMKMKDQLWSYLLAFEGWLKALCAEGWLRSNDEDVCHCCGAEGRQLQKHADRLREARAALDTPVDLKQFEMPLR